MKMPDPTAQPSISKISDLAGLGIGPAFLLRLAETLGGTLDLPLTEFQREVLQDPDFVGKQTNLLVAGPTSAGKTLVATVLTALTLQEHQNAKIIYVVPLRALVTEKEGEWSKLFIDSRVLPVSSDYPRSDHYIRTGNWDIAIVVFEKLYQWLSETEVAKSIIPRLSLVIIDEMQILGEEGRGEKLEIAISLLRYYQESQTFPGNGLCRLLGMGVSLEIANGLREWLNAKLLPVKQTPRPVRLFESKVTTGKQGRNWCVYDDAIRAVLPIIAVPPRVISLLEDSPSWKTLILRAVSAGLRVLVYVASRRDVVKTAQDLTASLLSLFPNEGLHPSIKEEIEELEESPTLLELRFLLAARLGVHHGHMTPPERSLVEVGFRGSSDNPAVRVLVATRTLGMGVNLPADVVVLKDTHTGIGGGGLSSNSSRKRKLTVAEYRNFAGRAGRLRPGLPSDAFGLVVVYDKGGDWEGVADELLCGTVSALTSRLHEPYRGWGAHAVTAIAFHEAFHRTGTSMERIQAVLDRSYLWVTGDSEAKELISSSIETGLKHLQRLNVVGEYGLTGLGNAISRFGLSTSTIELLTKIAQYIRFWWPNRKLGLLYELFKTPELGQYLEPPPNRQGEYSNQESNDRALEARAYFNKYLDPEELVPGSSLRNWVQSKNNNIPSNVDASRFAKAIALSQWSRGVPLLRLTDFFTSEMKTKLEYQESKKRFHGAFNYIALGNLGDAGEMATTLISALRNLIGQIDTNQELTRVDTLERSLWLWEQTVRHGVALDMVAIPIIITYATNEKLRRHTIIQLFDAIGRQRDPRNWLDRNCPPGIRSRVWHAFQAGLHWWRTEAAYWYTSDQDAGVLHLALEEVASIGQTTQAGSLPVSLASGEGGRQSPPARSQQIAQDVESEGTQLRGSLENLEDEAKAQIESCKDDPGRLISILEQELARAPLSAKIRTPRTSGERSRRRMLVLLPFASVPIVIWQGDFLLSNASLLQESKNSAATVVLVTGTISDQFLKVPSGIQSIVRVSSLLAICRLAQHHPSKLSSVVRTLTEQGVILRRAAEVLPPTSR